jgi:hypothetical protein
LATDIRGLEKSLGLATADKDADFYRTRITAKDSQILEKERQITAKEIEINKIRKEIRSEGCFFFSGLYFLIFLIIQRLQKKFHL